MSKTVIITGASKGIGRACAEKFYNLGYNVAAVYCSDDEAMRSFCIGKDNARILLIKADVSDFDAMGDMADRVSYQFGSIDVLVNNAGIAEQKMMKFKEE